VATGVLAALLSVAGALAGCSASDPAGGGRAATPPPPRVSPPGPYFGECGSVNDTELEQAVGLSTFTSVFRNSVGCVWEDGAAGMGGPVESFSWYRGSPIGREMAGSGLIGRPPDRIQVQGHSGFRGQIHQGGDICEISVQYGDDFFEWSISYGNEVPPVSSCDAAMKLVNLTMSRTK
jgi:hypothetical protein